MILQGPFLVPSLWFCDHMGVAVPGSLSAAECSPAWRRGSREQSEAPAQAPRGSPGQQREEQGRGRLGDPPGCLFPETSCELAAAPSRALPVSRGFSSSVALSQVSRVPPRAGCQAAESALLAPRLLLLRQLGNPQSP